MKKIDSKYVFELNRTIVGIKDDVK